jgi:hypothetical protein
MRIETIAAETSTWWGAALRSGSDVQLDWQCLRAWVREPRSGTVVAGAGRQACTVGCMPIFQDEASSNTSNNSARQQRKLYGSFEQH